MNILIAFGQIHPSFFHKKSTYVQEWAIPPLLVSQKIRVTSPLTVFLKYGQLDLSKASDSISQLQ